MHNLYNCLVITGIFCRTRKKLIFFFTVLYELEPVKYLNIFTFVQQYIKRIVVWLLREPVVHFFSECEMCYFIDYCTLCRVMIPFDKLQLLGKR